MVGLLGLHGVEGVLELEAQRLLLGGQVVDLRLDGGVLLLGRGQRGLGRLGRRGRAGEQPSEGAGGQERCYSHQQAGLPARKCFHTALWCV